jgi:hypothetical protein
MIMLTPKEQIAINNLRDLISCLTSFFSQNSPPLSDDSIDWYNYLVQFKDKLGNVNNQISFVATLLAKSYLMDHFDLIDFDAAAKAQGAPGLDIDAKTKRDQHIIAEIKTTHPYKDNDLGAQQIESFQKDAKKLHQANADIKFFFVTDSQTFALMKETKYRSMFSNINIVYLLSGEKITA